MPWYASLQLDYSLREGRSVAHFNHQGPLRVLQSLYPEGDGVCHNVLVHPPGGLVGGDTLALDVRVAPGAHGLITTPGASRFYRSLGEPALQRTTLSVDDGARLEWLPMEALCYSGCLAENQLRLALAPGAEMMGWDLTALGLPQAGQPFEAGHFVQHIELPGAWLERARIEAQDSLLKDSPLGMAGRSCIATLFFAAGRPLDKARREAGLELARERVRSHELSATAGVTGPNEQVLVLRVLAPVVEPAMQLLRTVWAGWRQHFWQMQAPQPRIWST